ncbi:DUF397 domain-containing protein [Streptomyces sp. GLT-R25]
MRSRTTSEMESSRTSSTARVPLASPVARSGRSGCVHPFERRRNVHAVEGDNWRKSSHSSEGDGNACVETANSPTQVAVRETKAPARATLTSRPEPSPSS